MGKIIGFFIALVSGLPKPLAVFVLAMVPIIELRGAIPLAVAWDLNPSIGFFSAILGNLVPIFPLLLFLGPVSQWLQKHFAFFKGFFQWVFNRSRQHEDKIKRYGYWGLALFVAIPFPGTGVWVGSALAFLLGLKIIPSFLAMALGVLGAGTIMLLLSWGIAELAAAKGTLAAVIGILILVSIIIFRKRN